MVNDFSAHMNVLGMMSDFGARVCCGLSKGMASDFGVHMNVLDMVSERFWCAHVCSGCDY